ncbi:MAG: ribosomal-processing cysteine protease Prp [Vulcanimicrobiota bacterium]
MVQIFINLDQHGNPVSLEVTGHAELDERGSDVACAGISALAQALLLGINEVLKIKSGYEVEDGNLYITLPRNLAPDVGEKARVLFEAIILGLEKIEELYPGRIRIIKEIIC